MPITTDQLLLVIAVSTVTTILFQIFIEPILTKYLLRRWEKENNRKRK